MAAYLSLCATCSKDLNRNVTQHEVYLILLIFVPEMWSQNLIIRRLDFPQSVVKEFELCTGNTEMKLKQENTGTYF